MPTDGEDRDLRSKDKAKEEDLGAWWSGGRRRGGWRI